MLDTSSVALLYVIWFVGAFILAWTMLKLNS